jgi:hypothetical protein
MPSAASRSSIPRGRTLAWARPEPAVREAEQTQRFASHKPRSLNEIPVRRDVMMRSFLWRNASPANVGIGISLPGQAHRRGRARCTSVRWHKPQILPLGLLIPRSQVRYLAGPHAVSATSVAREGKGRRLYKASLGSSRCSSALRATSCKRRSSRVLTGESDCRGLHRGSERSLRAPS